MILHSQPRYCPHCGSNLEQRFVEAEGRDRLVCSSHDHIFYINPKIVAGTIPEKDGRVWLLRRAIEPAYGDWTFPAGFMEMGETVPEAAARETYEELTLEVNIGSLVGIYSYPGSATVHIVYRALALSVPTGGSETLEFALFEPEAIPWSELAFHSTRDALRDWTRKPA